MGYRSRQLYAGPKCRSAVIIRLFSLRRRTNRLHRSDEFQIRVECYAGYRGEESPRRFYLGERAVEVEELLDRWVDPRHRYFKLRGGDGSVYILRHDTEADQWQLI